MVAVGGSARVSARGHDANDGRRGAGQDSTVAGQVADEAEQHKGGTYLRKRYLFLIMNEYQINSVLG